MTVEPIAPGAALDPDDGTPDLLRRTAELAIAYRESLATRPVRPEVGYDHLLAAIGGPLPAHGEGAAAVVELLAREVPPGLIAMPGPRFFGFVLGGGVPAAVAADWLTAVWDQNSPFAAVTPAPAVAERVAGEWLLELFGLPAGSSVGFTTGATVANFVGVAAGRHAALAKAGWDVERNGLPGAPTLTVVAGADAHVTLFHSIRLLGLGTDCVQRVAVDDQGRMRLDALRDTVSSISGPAIVCLQAGNVNSGAFDPLADAITVIREHLPDAWIHVDGAFGLWAAVSPSIRHLMAGAAGADSWSTDAHKWLNVPFDCGLIFVRDRVAHGASMAITASYLLSDEEHLRDSGDYVPELSRRARGFPVYAALRSLGRDGVVDLVERCCRYARRFAAALAAEPGVAILNDVVLNQVLVRFDGSDDRTRDVTARIQADGTAWFGGGSWQGQHVMRISVINWWTRDADVERSIDAIRRSLAASRAGTAG
jgi:glutamate/tyrosine decarboxylase-like PLP-dependent enzyme